MADPDPVNEGSAANTGLGTPNPKSKPTGNKHLSTPEVASFSESDALAKKAQASAERQALYNSVCKELNKFHIYPSTIDFSELSELSSTPDSSPDELPITEPYVGNYPFDDPNATVLPSIEMPYNNTAIPPSEEVTVARVKRILAMDEDISACSANAAFAITIATECFIRYLAEQSMNVVKSERKPRRNIQYKDVANAVARIDNLEFLADVVPKTLTFREFNVQKAARAVRKQEMLQAGQTTLDGSGPAGGAPAGVMDVEKQSPDEQTANGRSGSQEVSPQASGNADIRFRHYQPNGDGQTDEPRDVEMG